MPKIVNHAADVEVTSASTTITLVGSVLLSSPMNVAVGWLIDGVNVKFYPGKYDVLTNKTLSLKSVTTADTGLYQIVYTFDRGRASDSVMLNVTGEVPGNLIFKKKEFLSDLNTYLCHLKRKIPQQTNFDWLPPPHSRIPQLK